MKKWKIIITVSISSFIASFLKGFVYISNLVNYSFWKDQLVFLLCYIPVCIPILFLLEKFTNDEKEDSNNDK